MWITEAAREAGVNVQTLRYYERRGLLPRPARRGSGYREFSPDAVQIVRFIKRAQELGFSLAEIRELLLLQDTETKACPQVRDLLKRRLATVRKKISDLRRLERHLESALHACNDVLRQDGADKDEGCPVLRAISDEQRKTDDD